jgi:hypothetical protein
MNSPEVVEVWLLVCHKAVIESADKLETSDSGRTRKNSNKRQKSWVERGVAASAKRSAEGTKRGVVAFRRKKLILAEGYHGAMLITFRTAWSKCFAAEEPPTLTCPRLDVI